MEKKLTYYISGYKIELLSDFPEKLEKLLYGFAPFVIQPKTDNQSPALSPAIMKFVINQSQNPSHLPFPEKEGEMVHTFAIEEGKCTMRKYGDKYNFTILQDRDERLPLVLDMELGSSLIKCTCGPANALNPDNLKFALWIAFGFVAIPKQTVALHSSVIIYNNRAILFLGESGTGKSTHTKLWLQHLPGSRLLNDDSPVVRIEFDGTNQPVPFVYGSPWSGKGQCHINECYPVAAFVRLKQHPANNITKLSKLESFGALYPSFPPAFLKDDYFEEQICGIISNIIMTTPVYRLQCLPDSQAAELVKITVFK
jgi:hypothetical protein